MPGTPRRLTKEDVLRVLDDREREEYPVMTTAEIVERADASRPVVTDRLNELLEEDEPRIRMANKGQARVYWLAGERMVRREQSSESDVESSTASESEEQKPAKTDGGEVTRKDVEEIQRRTTRENSAVRMAGGILVGIVLTLMSNHSPFGETTLTIAGLALLYGMLYGIIFIWLYFKHNVFVRSDSEASSGMESSTDAT